MHTTAIKHLNQCSIFWTLRIKSQRFCSVRCRYWKGCSVTGERNCLSHSKNIGRELMVRGAPEFVEAANKRNSAKQALENTVTKPAHKNIMVDLLIYIFEEVKLSLKKETIVYKKRTNPKIKILKKRIISRKPHPKRSRIFSRVKNANFYCNTI